MLDPHMVCTVCGIHRGGREAELAGDEGEREGYIASEIDSLKVNHTRFAHSHLFVKKSGGGEGVPSDGAGSHLTGSRAACVGSGVAGAVVDFSPGDCFVDFAARSDS